MVVVVVVVVVVAVIVVVVGKGGGKEVGRGNGRRELRSQLLMEPFDIDFGLVYMQY